MKEQNFKNHAKYVPGFHLLTFFVILAALIIAIILVVHEGLSHETGFYVLVGLSLGLLFFYLRQFSTGNQYRIIRAEENFRNYRLSGKTLDSRLMRAQVIVLRFADDSEYTSLMEKTIQENLGQKELKKSIRQWRADHHRV